MREGTERSFCSADIRPAVIDRPWVDVMFDRVLGDVFEILPGKIPRDRFRLGGIAAHQHQDKKQGTEDYSVHCTTSPSSKRTPLEKKIAGICRPVSIILLAFTSAFCKSLALPDTARYYEIWDKAAILYYGEPRNVDGAIDLLVHGCKKVSERRDVSCYNLGVMLELEGRREEARKAYERARDLHPHPMYDNAVVALGGKGDVPAAGKAVGPLRRLEEGCRANNEPLIRKSMDELSTLIAEGSAPPRETLTQPFFADCLKGIPESTALIAKLVPAKDHAEAMWYRYRARHHPFWGVWDIELYLRGAVGTAKSGVPTTVAWQKFLTAASQSNGELAGREIQNFDKAISGLPAAFRVPIRRAAAALIQSDALFESVKKDPGVAAFVRSEFGG